MGHLLSNNPTHAGIDKAIDQFQDYMVHSLKNRNAVRTHNNGLCLACILLDVEYRASVSGIMTKKKDRKKVNIPGNPTTHLFEKILVDAFMDPNYTVPSPKPYYFDEFPDDKKAGWNPNSPSIFEHHQDGAWLRSTWEDNVQLKNKKALDRWNKDTGGSNGTPTSIIDFCLADCWLGWIFCADLECNFLLGKNAGGRMPRHLQVESGFLEQDSISDVGEETSPAKKKNSTNDRLNSKLSMAKKQHLQLDGVMETVTTHFAGKTDAEERSLKDNYIQKIVNYFQHDDQ